MAGEGLKIIVGADVKPAERALKGFVNTAQQTGNKAGVALGTGLNKVAPAIQKIQTVSKPATIAVSKLNDSIETLREKLLAKQQFLITEKDITKVAILNKEIRALQGEILRVQAVGKGGVDLGGVGTGFKKGFGALRTASNIVPGLGIAALLGAGVDAITSIFNKADEANEKVQELLVSVSSISSEAAAGTAGESAKVNALAGVVTNLNKSYTERNRALNELKSINKNYFGDLTLEASSLKILKERVDEYSKALIQQAIIKKFADKIADISVAIQEQSQVLAGAGADVKKFQRILQNTENEKPVFSGLAAQAETDRINKASNAVESANKNFSNQGVLLNKLKDQSNKLSDALRKAVEESLKFKPLEDPKGGSKAVDDTIERAKKLASFLDDNTQFSVSFEVDPRLNDAENIKNAKAFLAKAKDFFENNSKDFLNHGVFLFKPRARLDFQAIADPKFFGDIKEQAGIESTKTFKEVKKEFEENAERLAKSNPLVIKTNVDVNAGLRLEELRNKQLQQAVGLNVDTSVLTDVEKRSVAAANAVNNILTPAFQNLFTSIKAGEDPLKAFFKGIADAVGQLIQKLIAAAIQAAVLSAIFPGGVGGVKGFGNIFKNIIGFASGGIVSGPTLALVGEGRGTSASNPEVIAPLDQLRGMLGDLGGNRNVNVVVTGRLRGRDQVLQNARTISSQRRLGAG